MKGFISGEFLALAASMFLLGGCAFPEHRQAVAAQRDDTRRTEFEHCRAEGRTDCDAILNAPVTSTPHPDSVQMQERRKAYDRCVERRGEDCDDLLRQ
jgi:hypothetical protein